MASYADEVAWVEDVLQLLHRGGPVRYAPLSRRRAKNLIDYISSSGVGIFIGFQGKLREIGGHLTITRVTRTVREVFQILGMTGFLAIEDDVT